MLARAPEAPAPAWYPGRQIGRETWKAREYARALKLRQEHYDALPRRRLFVPLWFMPNGGVWV